MLAENTSRSPGCIAICCAQVRARDQLQPRFGAQRHAQMYHIASAKRVLLLFDRHASVLNIAVPVVALRGVHRVEKQLSVHECCRPLEDIIQHFAHTPLRHKLEQHVAILRIQMKRACQTSAVDRAGAVKIDIFKHPGGMEALHRFLQCGKCK